MDEVPLTAGEAELANAIRTLDAQLDELEARERRVLSYGLRGGRLGGWSAHRTEDAIDEERTSLLQRRADLAARLRHDVEGD